MALNKEDIIRMKEAGSRLISTIRVESDEETDRLLQFVDSLSRIVDILSEHEKAIEALASVTHLERVEIPAQEAMTMYVPKNMLYMEGVVDEDEPTDNIG